MNDKLFKTAVITAVLLTFLINISCTHQNCGGERKAARPNRKIEFFLSNSFSATSSSHFANQKRRTNV